MNDNMANGVGKLPPRLPLATAYKPRSLPEAQLRKMNHAEWLEMFSQILGLQTGVQMTAKREGTITRLYWASAYVKLLEDEIASLKLQLKEAQDVDNDDLRSSPGAEPDDGAGGTGNR